MTLTLYKVYAMALERLKEEVERKEIIPMTQMIMPMTGFGKGIETIDDNVYVLNYVANRQINKKEGSIIYRFKGGFRFGG